MYFIIFIYSIAILLLFRVATFLNRVAPLSSSVKQLTFVVLPFIELMAWLSFLVWSIRKIYLEQDYTGLIITAIVLLILLVPGFFMIRDFLTGFLLKIQRKVDEKSYIKVEGVQGIILKSGHFSMEIEGDDGDVKSIPYTRLRSKIISHSGKNNTKKHLIEFSLTSTLSEADFKSTVILALQNCVWVTVTHEPIIHSFDKTATGYSMGIYIFLAERKHADKTVSFIMKSFGQ